jgi:hypothetical protein
MKIRQLALTLLSAMAKSARTTSFDEVDQLGV